MTFATAWCSFQEVVAFIVGASGRACRVWALPFLARLYFLGPAHAFCFRCPSIITGGAPVFVKFLWPTAVFLTRPCVPKVYVRHDVLVLQQIPEHLSHLCLNPSVDTKGIINSPIARRRQRYSVRKIPIIYCSLRRLARRRKRCRIPSSYRSA